MDTLLFFFYINIRSDKHWKKLRMVFPKEQAGVVYPCEYCGSVQDSQAFSAGSQLVRGTIGTWLCDKARKSILATPAVSTHSSHCFQALPFVSRGAAWLSGCHGLYGPELMCCFSLQHMLLWVVCGWPLLGLGQQIYCVILRQFSVFCVDFESS